MKCEFPDDDFICYADGSSNLSTGQAGWGFVIYVNDEAVRDFGGIEGATNNQMELMAVIKVLEILPAQAAGVIRTDSNYVVQGINSWRASWEKKGWLNEYSKGKTVVNLKLWKELFTLKDAHHKVRVQWVKGHASDPGNIEADRLACFAAKTVMKSKR